MSKTKKVMSIRMNVDTFEYLERLSALDDRTPSYIVRKMIASFSKMSDEDVIKAIK